MGLLKSVPSACRGGLVSLWFLFHQVRTAIKTIVIVVIMIRTKTTDTMAAIMAVFSLAVPRPPPPFDKGLGLLFRSEGDDRGADTVDSVDEGVTSNVNSKAIHCTSVIFYYNVTYCYSFTDGTSSDRNICEKTVLLK